MVQCSLRKMYDSTKSVIGLQIVKNNQSAKWQGVSYTHGKSVRNVDGHYVLVKVKSVSSHITRIRDFILY